MSDGNSTSTYINHQPSYHDNKDATYVLPNDAPEHVRLETQARHLAAIMNNQIVHAPTSPTSKDLRILDVGCGTGIVTDYLGTRFPAAEVIGLDLSAVPRLRDRPSNVRFLQGDILRDDPRSWKPASGSPSPTTTLPPGPQLFDLIFSRLLVCGMDRWPAYISTAHGLLRAGGHLEIHDLDWIWYDKNSHEISDAWPWWRTLRAAGEARGLDWECGSKAQRWMREAGFADVQVSKYYWPFGGQWEADPAYREFGEYVRSNMVSMVWHMIPRLLREAGMDDGVETVERMREEMIRDFQPEEGKHWVFYVTVGRKAE